MPVLELERTPAVAAVSQRGREAELENSASLLDKLSPLAGAAGSSLDNYVTSARTPTLASDWQSRRVRRFYQRYFTGVGVGGALRVLTLTTSDAALAQGKDIHRSWRALVMRLRRRWGRFEYIGVREFKGDRVHIHMVFRGDFMAQAQVSALWQVIHASPVVDIRAVWGSRGGANYLVKYLTKAVANRYWASYGWVFRGWVGWSKSIKRVLGVYPSKEHLTWLARLGGVTSASATELSVGRFPWLAGRLEYLLT